MTVFIVEAVAMATAAIAQAVGSTSKATEAAHRVPDCSCNLVHASPVESLAIELWTARQALQRVLLPLD